MDAKEINRIAWDSEVEKHNYWTIPVNSEEIEAARNKNPKLHLTPIKYMPLYWLNDTGADTLLLGGGGGQQGPLLSAYGKRVTVVDISSNQLENDRAVCEREGLDIKTINCDMCNLEELEDSSFDLVINPQAINFVPNLDGLYGEVDRVLKKGGVYILSFANPTLYLFDADKLLKGKVKIKYTLPFKSEVSMSRKEVERLIEEKGTLEYSHTLDDIIGSILKRGFLLSAFYSDGSDTEPIDSYLVDCYMALRFIKV
ncbi:MAG: class I SAM-dependent methyltransferase [Sphaerochaetaceae bacterium]|nr:class I SAM-dependent methyltransferase [Sphaerochaetaceae bacterium]